MTAVRKEFGQNQVAYFPGCTHEAGSLDLHRLATASQNADTIVFCMEKSSYTEFFGSLDDLYLPKEQIALAQAVKGTRK